MEYLNDDASALTIEAMALVISNLTNKLSEYETVHADMLFGEFLLRWIDTKKVDIQSNTMYEYKKIMNKHLIPYFNEKGITLQSINTKIIEEYYQYKLRIGMCSNTLVKHHAQLHTALTYAFVHDMIPNNPMLKVNRPKTVEYHSSFYSIREAQELLSKAQDNKYYVPIVLAITLGLRRSEIVGLMWRSINLSEGSIKIENKTIHDGGKEVTMSKMKNETSYRILVMPTQLTEFLSNLYLKQSKIKEAAEADKLNNFEYVCLDDNGKRLTLNGITCAFPELLNKLGMPKLRFHDLRHTCASILVNNGCSMKQIQDWLGHSNYATTAKVYAHLDMNSKEKVAAKIDGLLQIP